MESVKKWLNERTVKKNGLYVHYSPPKVIGAVSAAQLRQWARGGTDNMLERAVLAGQGHRLLAEAESLPLSHHIPALVAKCDALHSAVERGSLLELQELLESDYNRRKNVMCRDEAGVGLLHKAVFYDFMDIVKYLVTNYPQLVHQKDSEGRTALHYAAVCRDEAAAATLLEGAGAVRGARDASGRTPGNYRGAGRTLLALPTTDDMARENAKNTPGLVIKRHNIRIWFHDCDMARLQRVVWDGHGARLLSEVSNQHVVKRFLEAVPYIMNTIRDIHNAVIQNNLEDVMKLSSDPVPPQILSSRDAYNMTVMHKAAGLGHVSIMKYIAERYPQGINDVDNDGRTPLHYAAGMRDDQHTYNTLVGLGADESAVDNKNRTPGYYINRPQEIDKNHLKSLPDAPRTPSSAYPTTWDWKLLDNDVIAELNKKSRRRNLKASTENLSSKNNTNTLSENIENKNNTIKASSTHELINNLPELDDSSKLNNNDGDANIEPEIGDNNEQTNTGTETKLIEEDHDVNYDHNHDDHHDDNQDDSHDNNQDDHHDDHHDDNQDDSHDNNQDDHQDDNKAENRDGNCHPDQNHTENHDENHEEHHHPIQNQDVDKGENYDDNHHPDQNHLEYKSMNHGETHIQNEDDNDRESNHLNKIKDESKGENLDKNDDTKESVTKELKIPIEEESKEHESMDKPNEKNTECLTFTADNVSETVENSEVKHTLAEDLQIHLDDELDTRQNIPSNKTSPSSMKQIVEEAEEATTLKAITDHEEISGIEDINRKSATPGKQKVIDQNLLQIENGEKESEKINIVDNDVAEILIIKYHEKDSDKEKGKDTEFQKELSSNEIIQEEPIELKNTNAGIPEALKENDNSGVNTNSVETKSKENGSAIINNHTIQHTEQTTNTTTENSKDISPNEDDDDVQVQGDNNSEYKDLNLKSTPELTDSGSAKGGNVINGRNTQESLLEGIITSEAEHDSQDASFTQKDGHREVFVFDSEIDPEVTDLINNANMEMLATLVLNGEGSRLIGRESTNTELQAFLDNVPTYMQKINKVHLAAKEGNLKDLQAALDRRKFAIARDPISPNGTTPLHIATIFGKTNIMKYLGGRFPETLSAVDFEGRTALHYAAVLPDNGHYYTLLQQLGANSKDLDDNGKSAEDYYTNPCLLPFDQMLSDFGIDEDAVKNMFSDKAPCHGSNGHMDIPIFRTEEGRYLAQSLGDPLIKGLTEVANVKPKDPVAFLASFLQNFPDSEKPTFEIKGSNMSETLEETGLESEMRTKEDKSAEVITNARRSAARTATRSHRPIDVITVDPQPVISPDAPETASSSANRDEHGQSMLHFAAARTHSRNALFQLLQESEISLGYRDELYRTARDVSLQANVPENAAEIDKWVLHLGAKGNTEKIMELLLEGYDHILDVVDENGVSITEVVIQRGDTDMSNLLASIPAFEESRESMHSAVRRGDLPAVQEILSAVNDRSIARSQNSLGRTALHIAILAQHEDIVAYLAQTYPELLRIGDNLERTPLHYAMGVEKIESLSRILIRAGAKRVLKDLKGRQASYYFMNKSDILRLKEEEDAY